MYKPQNFINEQHTEKKQGRGPESVAGAVGKEREPQGRKEKCEKGQKFCGQDKGTVYVYMKVAS